MEIWHREMVVGFGVKWNHEKQNIYNSEKSLLQHAANPKEGRGFNREFTNNEAEAETSEVRFH